MEILASIGFFIAGLMVIKFFEPKEKPKAKKVRIELDEHERKISQN